MNGTAVSHRNEGGVLMGNFAQTLNRLRKVVATRDGGLDRRYRTLLVADLRALLRDWERLDGIVREKSSDG